MAGFSGLLRSHLGTDSDHGNQRNSNKSHRAITTVMIFRNFPVCGPFWYWCRLYLKWLEGKIRIILGFDYIPALQPQALNVFLNSALHGDNCTASILDMYSRLPRLWDLGFRVKGLGFGVKGFGLRDAVRLSLVSDVSSIRPVVGKMKRKLVYVGVYGGQGFTKLGLLLGGHYNEDGSIWGLTAGTHSFESPP